MEHVTFSEPETPDWSDAARRGLTDPLSASNLAINHYRLDPGGRVAGLHAHERQAEVFVVLQGTATFETRDGAVDLEAVGAVRFAPGEHKSATNRSDGRVSMLALGAPPDGGDVFVPLGCPECGYEELRLAIEAGTEGLVCPECGATREPRCPDCDGTDLRTVRDEERGRPISECRDCGTRFDL